MLNQSFRDRFPNGIQLRGDVLLMEQGNSIHFRLKQELVIRTNDVNERSVLKKLRSGLSMELLNNYLISPKIEKMLDLLCKGNYLKPYIPPNDLENPLGRQMDWLSHFSDNPTQVQDAISSSTIVILGCGGTGSIVAEHLVRSGAKNLVILDGGIVDIPDMNRQTLYYPNDCGRYKTEVLKERLTQFDTALKITTVTQLIRNKEDITEILNAHRPNLVINCADTPIGLIHAWVAEACLETNVPALFGGVGLCSGTLGPLLVSDKAKQEYSKKTRQAHTLLKDNQNILKASLSFTNSMMAVWIALEAFKFLNKSIPCSIIDKAININLLTPHTEGI